MAVAAESLPGVPIDVAFKIGAENFDGAVATDKGDGGAADGVAEAEEISLHELEVE